MNATIETTTNAAALTANTATTTGATGTPEQTQREQLLQKHSGEDSWAPCVLVNTYHKYNNGLGGAMWVDLTTFWDEDDFLSFCTDVLHNDEEDPELMFQDYVYFPREYWDETEINYDAIMEYNALDEDEQEAFEVYLRATKCGDHLNTIEDFHDCYQGEWRYTADFAEHICEEYGWLDEVSDFLRGCIDFEAVWRNLETGGDYWEQDGYIFANN